MKMVEVVESCRLKDEVVVKHLRHLKCRSCGARFFDDEAMHHIQSARSSHHIAHAV